MIDARAIRRGLWLTAALPLFLTGSPAMARDSDHWPRLDPQWSRTERDDRPAGSIQFLSATDRMRLAEMRVRSAIIDSGTASLSLLGGRARSLKASEGTPVPFDRFSIKEVGIAAHADVGPGLALVLGGNYSVMKRRPEFAWTGGRRSSTSMASTGLALRSANGNRIAVDYLTVTPRARQANIRMAELMGGAPLAGSGVQISLSGRSALAGSGILAWSVSGASISRRGSDSALLGERTAGTDHRLSIHLNGRF
jgi:hypothetical protein